MDAQLQTQYYTLLGMLEDAGPTVRGHYEALLKAAFEALLKEVNENEGGKGSDSYAAFIIALQVFLINQLK